jgi:hypothetical protein
MAIGKRLGEVAILPVAMATAVFLSLWILFGLLHVERFLGAPIPTLTPEDSGMGNVGIVPGAGHWAKMQRALIGKGYAIAPSDSDGDDNTLIALEAFQDDSALPVQPKCDQACWKALGL